MGKFKRNWQYPYKAEIQFALSNLEPNSEKCMVFCHPIGSLCKLFAQKMFPEDLNVQQGVFQISRRFLNDMVENYLTEMLGHARYIVAAAFIYISAQEYPHPIPYRIISKRLFTTKGRPQVTETSLRNVAHKILHFQTVGLTSLALQKSALRYGRALREKIKHRHRRYCGKPTFTKCPLRASYRKTCPYIFQCKWQKDHKKQMKPRWLQ
jgi:hypothetical protein